MVIHCIRIDFRNDEWHLRVLAKRRAVIHDDTAALDRFVSKLQGLVATSTENRYIEAIKAFRGGFFDGPSLITIGLSLPC